MGLQLFNKKGKLKELAATSICGNDISSSCLYVSALAIAAAGQYAWISLLIVAFVLFFLRKIYGEVVGALPMNGGTYNALLNTTSKKTAALAACLTILSYMATAVISGSEAMHYIHTLFEGFPVFIASFVLLFLFMLLNIAGITESAKVATGIFVFHLFSLTLLAGVCGWFLFQNGFEALLQNFQEPVKNGSIAAALFFGFAASMLGISGFESSANYVEEQARGVFPKTLRNMWVVVSVFNPLMAFLTLSIMTIPEVQQHKNALLSHLGMEAGGNWLMWVIAIDAAIVLSGAVLTSYVGVAGLVKRMSLDRCLPRFLIKRNKKGTAYPIMIAFFLLCASILFITSGKIEALAGVYLVAFLSVILLFTMGNILLKIKRARLPRPEKASVFAIAVAIVGVGAALVANIYKHPEYFKTFLWYFLPTVFLVGIMLFRIPLLKTLKRFWSRHDLPYSNSIIRKVKGEVKEINAQKFVFFLKEDDLFVLNKALIYIDENEDTKKVVLVNVSEKGTDKGKLKSDIETFGKAYPDIDIELETVQGKFRPKLVDSLSEKWGIPKNYMFIGAPKDNLPYRIDELGDVRVIV